MENTIKVIHNNNEKLLDIDKIIKSHKKCRTTVNKNNRIYCRADGHFIYVFFKSLHIILPYYYL